MAKRFGHPRFYELLEQMADLHSRKNHDYSGTADPLKNLRAPTRIGIDPFIGVLVRLQDKWSRLEQFANSGELLVKGESVIDTLMDNAVYSLLAIILYEEQKAAYDAVPTPETTPGYGGKPKVLTEGKGCVNCKHRPVSRHDLKCFDCCGTDDHKNWEAANA